MRHRDDMKLCLLAALLVLPALPISAQTQNVPTGQESRAMPQTGASPLQKSPPEKSPLETRQVGPDERQFFDLGATLARGAFAYAELAKQAAAAASGRDKLAQVRRLSRLDPLAGRSRLAAREEIRRAEALMRELHASAGALAPVSAATVRLSGTLPTSGDAQALAFFSPPAARTVSSLNEFETLSSLPDDPALRVWLAGAAPGRSAQAWYAAGKIAALAQIAAAQEMPDLLPPPAQIVTELRGLRDWLALPQRPPTQSPSPQQAALRQDVSTLLDQASLAAPPGVKPPPRLTSAQLQALGSISRRVQAEVLGADGAETAARR